MCDGTVTNQTFLATGELCTLSVGNEAKPPPFALMGTRVRFFLSVRRTDPNLYCSATREPSLEKSSHPPSEHASREALAGLTRQQAETVLSARWRGRWSQNASRASPSLKYLPRRRHCAGSACGCFRIMLDCWQAASMVWLPCMPTLVALSVLDDANDDASRASQVVCLALMQLTALLAFSGSGCATASMAKLDASWAVFVRFFCT
jgi:hypothetical protein